MFKEISKRVEERCQCCSQWSLSDFKKGSSEMLQFDVIDETLSLTNLKQIKKGTKVNLERSMTVKTEIGGHLLSGHIHCEGTISKITKVSIKLKTC